MMPPPITPLPNWLVVSVLGVCAVLGVLAVVVASAP